MSKTKKHDFAEVRLRSSLQNSESTIPAALRDEPERVRLTYLRFLAAISSDNTRLTYKSAIDGFLAWIQSRGLSVSNVNTPAVSAFVAGHLGAPATIRLQLSAVKAFFDAAVRAELLFSNPAASVNGPRGARREGKTVVASEAEIRRLFEKRECDKIIGARDRALISVMYFGLSRVSAALSVRLKDFYRRGDRHYLLLREKGQRNHEIPCHPELAGSLSDYIALAKITAPNALIFRKIKDGALVNEPFSRANAYAMVKRCAKAAALPSGFTCHSLRRSSITHYLRAGGSLQVAAALADHGCISVTHAFYDARKDGLNLEDIDRLLSGSGPILRRPNSSRIKD